MKHTKRFTALILALVMVFSLTVSASAATAQQVTVKLSPGITVEYDGEPQALKDVNGNPVYPILYGGTTYLPVRAVSNILGLDVDWEQATQTVRLDKTSTPTKTTGKAASGAASTDITVQINPGITVKYNGMAQEMEDTNGNPVYPMLYGGTTYLPVRAVSNMLGVRVDWDQDTQTVSLDKPIVFEIGTSLKYGPDDRDICRKDLEDFGFDEEKINMYLGIFDENLAMWQAAKEKAAESRSELHTYTAPNGTTVTLDKYALSGTRKTLLNAGFTQEKIDQIIYGLTDDPLRGEWTSEDANVLGENHIGYDWGEIDWSTASKGYVRVKINTQLVSFAKCKLTWIDETNNRGDGRIMQMNIAKTSDWQNIPLGYSDGEQECVVSISYGIWPGMSLQARFSAKIDDLDNMWLMSNVQVDYENAPKTCAKALEITKNCKTDAEKITAVYNFVSSTLTYDWELYNWEKANGSSGSERDLNPDSILASKKGVCEHYAVLMTAMLRSIGVPCKFVTGQMKNNGEWESHAWVAVKPETGTLNISGMGKDLDVGYFYDDDGNQLPGDPTGWIRLDPTNAHVPNFTANDSNYRTSDYY